MSSAETAVSPAVVSGKRRTLIQPTEASEDMAPKHNGASKTHGSRSMPCQQGYIDGD